MRTVAIELLSVVLTIGLIFLFVSLSQLVLARFTRAPAGRDASLGAAQARGATRLATPMIKIAAVCIAVSLIGLLAIKLS